MKTITRSCALLCAFFAWAAALPAHADPLLFEDFDDVGALPGWLLINQSQPPGQSWFQGNAGIFPSQAGAPGAYIAANFLSAQNGLGLVDNWLITPELTLSGPTRLSFYTRGAGDPGFADTLELRFGAGAVPASLTQTLLSIGGAGAYPSDWRQYTADVDFTGTGRFAFRYTGAATSADYIGIDSVAVAAVPEPSCWLLLAAGLALLGWRGWRRAGDRRAAALGALAAAGLCQFASAQAAERSEPAWQQAQAAAPAQEAGGDGMVVVRDAVTGELRPPTPAEFHALHGPAAAARRAAAAAPRVVQRTDGTRQAHLGASGQVYLVTRRGAAGALDEQCVQGQEAADRLLDAGETKPMGAHHEND